MVVRDCALDSGGLNADTELVRIKSQCGAFYLVSFSMNLDAVFVIFLYTILLQLAGVWNSTPYTMWL